LRENSVKTRNENDIRELLLLQRDYNQKLSDYSTTYKLLMDSTTEYFDMLKSPLLNKNIRLSDGKIGYVTKMGVFRQYPSMSVYNDIVGKNGCPPAGYVQVQATILNDRVTTNPKLIVGRPMESGDSCGNEGKNVIASSTGTAGSHTYQGCYRLPPTSNALKYQDGLGSSATINSCKQLAHDTGNTVFALSSGGIGTSKCYIGNEFDDVEVNSESIENIISWETPANINCVYAKFNKAGQLTINGYKAGVISNIKTGLLFKIASGYMKDDVNYFVKKQITRTGNAIEFKTLADSTNNILGSSSKSISVEWIGYFKPTTTGEWTFYLKTDDCSFMWIGDAAKSNYSINNALVNNPRPHPPKEKNGKISLVKDVYYPIRIQFGQGQGPNFFKATVATPRGIVNDIGRYVYTTPEPFTSQLITPVSDSYDAQLWQSNPPQGNCDPLYGGNIVLEEATWGGNCNFVTGPNGQRYNISKGNVYDIVYNRLQDRNNSTYTVGDGLNGEDPALGCAKNFNATYRCGEGASKTINILNEAGGSVASFDCNSEKTKCNSYKLVLNNNGNLVVYQGKAHIWNTNTINKIGVVNEERKAINGKYKRNYLNPGEVLEDGEFLGSESGTCFLQMVKGRGLVLMYSKSNCSLIQGNTYGTKNMPDSLTMATYTIPENDMTNFNKTAYITKDGILREYDSTLLSRSKNYIQVGNYKLDGTNLSSMKGDIASCQTECNKNENCDGFIYENGTCNLRNTQNMYPTVNRYLDTNYTLYKRLDDVTNNSSCSKGVVQTTTGIYSGYTKGDNVNIDDSCGLSEFNKELKSQLDIKINNLQSIVNNINEKINKLSETDKKLLEKQGFNQKNINDNIVANKTTQEKYLGLKPTIVTAKGMESNSEDDMLSKSYYHILWSILAIMIVIGGIKMAK